MLALKNLTVQDKSIFDAYLGTGNVQTSELTFTNLFVWRKHYGYRWAEVQDTLVIVACDADEPFALFPLGSEYSSYSFEVLNELKEFFARQGRPLKIERADNEAVDELKTSGVSFIAENDPDNDDYVYCTEDILNLRGRRYDGKRNHLNRLFKEYTVEYEPVSSNNLYIAERVIRDWFCSRTYEYEDEPEWRACLELLDNYDALRCKGMLMFIDGAPAAVTFGEMLNRETAVIHFEKAVNNENGAYAAINHEFVAQEWYDTKYINREQDLGIPGLRRSKMSWKPDHKVEKFIITIW